MDPKYLASTPTIQASHPRIQKLAQDIAQGAASKRDEAVRIHDFVRDSIKFGIPASFYESTATDVLDSGIGYCNTKTTLFSALLRARGIQTRTKMMELSASVLRGLFDPQTPYVDHAITEVLLNDKWLQVDSYVVDRPLASVARDRLRREGGISGYGIHINGQSEWDGSGDSLIQCVMGSNGQGTDYVRSCHGYFDDVLDFYTKVPEAHNRKTLLTRMALWLMAGSISANIESVRRSSECTP